MSFSSKGIVDQETATATMRNFHRLARRHLHSRIISKETIKPSFPTPPHLKTYNLSFLDQINPSNYMPFVFFYLNYDSSSTVPTYHQERLATSQLLKKSLSQTLSQYYPFSGRFTAENRAYVDCNDEGVEFVEAQIDTTLSELIHVHSFKNQPLDQFFPTDGACGPIYKSSIRLVMVQLSYFACGGLALAVSMSHKIADACTFFNFVNHWAAVTRRNLGDQHVQPLSPHFIYSPNDIAYIPNYVIDKGSNLVRKKFVFPNSKLAELKAKAKDNKNASAGEEEEIAMMNPTRIEVLSSLLYGCAVRAAKKANSQSADSFVLAQVVNVRNRMVHPLPETAVGNNYLFSYITTVTESELVLSHLTARMKKAKMQLTGLTSSLVNQHLHQTADEAFDTSVSNKVETFAISSICRLPLYQVDFGWGKPVRVNICPGYLAKNVFHLMDTPSGDGIEAMLALEEENMAAFQNDEQLLAFAL